MLTLETVRDLPVSTAHETNSFHDKVEVGKHELLMCLRREEEYKRALQNCLKIAEKMQDEVSFLTQEDAQKCAEVASDFVAEVYRAFSYPVLSCTGKTEKGNAFYKAKVLIKFDTSG